MSLPILLLNLVLADGLPKEQKRIHLLKQPKVFKGSNSYHVRAVDAVIIR